MKPLHLDLDIHIEDAIFRIKDLFDRTNGNCYLSFSVVKTAQF